MSYFEAIFAHISVQTNVLMFISLESAKPSQVASFHSSSPFRASRFVSTQMLIRWLQWHDVDYTSCVCMYHNHFSGMPLHALADLPELSDFTLIASF